MKKNSFNNDWICNGRSVTLPHDAMIHETRNADEPGSSAVAYYPGGKYIYEKTFLRPEGEHVLLQFEGVYKDAGVFINGQKAGGAAYGYIPFFVNADPYLEEGTNTIRVECAVQEPDSRWYTGAGIYRPVWLWTGPEKSIEPESARISTVSYDPAIIRITLPSPAHVEIFDGEEKTAEGNGNDLTFTIKGAKLWSDQDPYLYEAVISNGEDCERIPFGIRKVEWSEKGLFINGRETLLKGGCLHHDNGILGAATYDESEFRRAAKLKEAGFNAIRSAHNPASRALLNACDRLGVYVVDEGWDMWFHHKSRFDYATEWREHHMADLTAMVCRDYNHPSVIMYSIGNEVSEPAKADGLAAMDEMISYLHKADPGRAVTGGFNLMIISRSTRGKGIYDDENGGRNEESDKKTSGMSSTMFNMLTSLVGTGMNKAANSRKADAAVSPALDRLDVCGYNYASGRYPLEGKAHPDRILFGSETFPQDLPKNWGMVRKYPYLVGDFMWTAWDYLGEAGLGAWAYTADGRGFNKPYPWLLADTGAFDIIGDPNGELFQASAVWHALDAPSICVQPLGRGRKPAKGVWRGTNALPSWSWKNCEGERATVEIYYDCHAIELLLNGKCFGRKRVKGCRTVFSVSYNPGTLTAIAFTEDGREIARNELLSAGKTGIAVVPEKKRVKHGEIVYVPVVLADSNGTVESNADRKIRIQVENGELLGFGSANPRTEERFDAGEYTTYYGRSLAILRAGERGIVRVTAKDERESASAEIVVQ